MTDDEIYVPVDVETPGPILGEYSMLSIGACLVADSSLSIYLELQPESTKHDPDALAVSGLCRDALIQGGSLHMMLCCGSNNG